MSRRVYIILSVVLALYLGAASIMAMLNDGVNQVCKGIKIEVSQPEDSLLCQGEPFVTAAELTHELNALPSRAQGMPMSSISPYRLRQKLERVDKIEDVEILTLTNGFINIKVKPFEPVMRIFDGDNSYYVNRQGKRVKASARYRANVPVVMGRFPVSDTVFTPLSLLPLIDYLNDHPLWGKFFTMIRVDSPNDVVLIPAIREHEVNLGSLDGLDNKLGRLKKFYTEVLPVKGWDTYKSLSLKWGGQLVATKRDTGHVNDSISVPDVDEAVDTGTMLAGDDVAPGQAIKGRKAHNDQPIPASTKPAN